MKLRLSPAEKAAMFKACDAAEKDANGDFMKVSAVKLMRDCVNREEIDPLDYAILDLACLMTTGKELPNHRVLKPAKRSSRKPPERKFKRGVGSY
jgi:hypothetical protein